MGELESTVRGNDAWLKAEAARLNGMHWTFLDWRWSQPQPRIPQGLLLPMASALRYAETFNGSQKCAENNKNYIFGKVLDLDAKRLDSGYRQCQQKAKTKDMSPAKGKAAENAPWGHAKRSRSLRIPQPNQRESNDMPQYVGVVAGEGGISYLRGVPVEMNSCRNNLYEAGGKRRQK